MRYRLWGPICAVVLGTATFTYGDDLDLTGAVVVFREGELPAGEKIAPTILVEEVGKRTGIAWKIGTDWPRDAGTIINVRIYDKSPENPLGFKSIPPALTHPEGFWINVGDWTGIGPRQITIYGADARGVMYGVGKFLRSLNWQQGKVSIPSDFKAAEYPDRPIRGHQIGYRNTANSWDAWNYDQFDQYFRELAIFGANSVENIPWQDSDPSPLLKYSREEMSYKFGELCAKYDLDHWDWVPVLFLLPDEEKATTFLQQQEEYYKKIKRLDAIFVPAGDPGNNKAVNLMPFLKQMADLLTKYHPKAKIWLSTQHFKADDIDFMYNYLDQQKPAWFGGLVMGPGSPPMEGTRKRLAKQYQLRWYPDVTHSVRAQYPVPWLDPILGMTLGRECVNPRPVDYNQIYQMDYGFTDGFITYSDGVHDDFNKNLWSQLGWNPNRSTRDIAEEYARFYFRPDVAKEGADGFFALETDMRGSLAENGAITSTFDLWKGMEQKVTNPGSKWRFRMHLFRAYYDYFTRERYLYETKLEQEALARLGELARLPEQAGVPLKLTGVRQILNRASSHPAEPELIKRLEQFGDELFQEIGLQTSVPKYHASNSQRGAVLDFIAYPLNNRWWLEDQFDQIEKMTDRNEQLKRIEVIRNWENPGEHGYYDVVGDVGRSPRLVKLLYAGDVMRNYYDTPLPTQRWLGEKPNKIRLAWHIYQDNMPGGIIYNGLDSSSPYIVKLFSQRSSPLVIDGKKAKLIKTGETYDKVTEQIFEVPEEASKDGKITLTWEALPDEVNMNWRQRHYVTDIWVMKRPADLKAK
ncbi:MAG: hypothetical protein U0903_09410 [Planctomycetales bacterium]